MRYIRWWLAVLILTTLPSASSAQGAGRDSKGPYRDSLHPGDVVRLKIWREPDLSGDFTVSESSEVVLPKLGAVSVSSLSADSLGQLVRASYQTYLKNPAIDVTVLRRINISGAVRNPGLYPVDGTMTVADAVSLAGGPTSDGRLDRVELIRGGKRLTVGLTPGSRLSDTPLSSGDQLTVPLRSWLARNASWLITGTAAMAGVIVAVAAH